MDGGFTVERELESGHQHDEHESSDNTESTTTTMKKNITHVITLPWVLFVLVIYIGSIVIWSIFYQTDIWLSNLMTYLPLFLIIPACLLLWKPHGTTSMRSSWRVTLVIILWCIIWIMFQFGGLFRYTSSLVDRILFFGLLLMMPVLILWATGTTITRESLGLQKGEMKPAGLFILVVILLFVPFIISMIVSGQLADLDNEQWIVLIISSTLLPAVFEELTFRGIVQTQVARHSNSEISGLLVASLIFGFGHVLMNASSNNGDLIAGILTSLFTQFAMGLFLGGIYIITGSIYASITVHYLNNSVVWMNKTLEATSLSYAADGFGWSYGLMLSVVVIIIGLLIRAGVIEIDTNDSEDEVSVDDIPIT